MWGKQVRLASAMLVAVLAAPVHAQRKTYLSFEPSGYEGIWSSAKWILLVAALGGVGHLCYWLLTTRAKGRSRMRTAAAAKEQVARSFEQRAAHLGFRHGEARTLERIALRLAPKSPASLLSSGSGREYLVGDLDRRIARRQKEVKVLERIKERLVVLRSQDVHERESVRVEANISVWVTRRGLSSKEMAALVEDEDEAEGEGLTGSVESVSGRLIDISEGGAAVEVEIPGVGRGDQVQFWSGDPAVVLGEMRAGVVSLETRQGATILHLHFIDPDLRELRAALAQLRGEQGDDEDQT